MNFIDLPGDLLENIYNKLDVLDLYHLMKVFPTIEGLLLLEEHLSNPQIDLNILFYINDVCYLYRRGYQTYLEIVAFGERTEQKKFRDMLTIINLQEALNEILYHLIRIDYNTWKRLNRLTIQKQSCGFQSRIVSNLLKDNLYNPLVTVLCDPGMSTLLAEFLCYDWDQSEMPPHVDPRGGSKNYAPAIAPAPKLIFALRLIPDNAIRRAIPIIKRERAQVLKEEETMSVRRGVMLDVCKYVVDGSFVDDKDTKERIERLSNESL